MLHALTLGFCLLLSPFASTEYDGEPAQLTLASLDILLNPANPASPFNPQNQYRPAPAAASSEPRQRPSPGPQKDAPACPDHFYRLLDADTAAPRLQLLFPASKLNMGYEPVFFLGLELTEKHPWIDTTLQKALLPDALWMVTLPARGEEGVRVMIPAQGRGGAALTLTARRDELNRAYIELPLRVEAPGPGRALKALFVRDGRDRLPQRLD